MKKAIIRIPFYKRLLSYIYPLTLRRGKGDINDYLELLLYHNRLQLATGDALYSDGDKYTPAITAVKAIKERLPNIKTVLVLGSGLGSIIDVIEKKGYHPNYTLVEMDQTVLGWALELLDKGNAQRTTPVCVDAETFMSQNQKRYDFIFIDIFNSMVVPDFVTSHQFLSQCRNSLSTNGCVALNYIVNNREWENVKKSFFDVFPHSKIVETGVNRVFVNVNT